MNRFRTIAITAIAGFVLVACGPAASSSTSQSAAGQPSQPASQAAQASGGLQASFGAGVVAELEALIPSTIGDMTMQKSSFRGSDYALDPSADADTIKFLNDVGVKLSDIAMAIGFGYNADYSKNASVIIIRASGADSGRLVAAFKTNMAATGSGSPIQWSSTSIGGKQVESNGDATQATYLYVKGDTLFIVSASDQATATEIFSGLP